MTFGLVWMLCGFIANVWIMGAHRVTGVVRFVLGLVCGPVALAICVVEWATRPRHNGP